MTQTLKDKFIAVADNERDLWNSLSEFLDTNFKIKEFKRIFALPHDKLILTRPSVSKTITFERVKPGYTYDKSVLFNEFDSRSNYDLVKKIIFDYRDSSKEVNFAIGDFQRHLVIEHKYTDLYNAFISKYYFQRNSMLGPNSFKKILDQVESGVIEDKLVIIVMRYYTGQYRALSKQGHSIKELPQGYDSGTEYPGDKNLTGLNNKMYLQIHLVYTDKLRTDEIIPMLAFHNPITKHSIRYATGDDFYDSI